MARSARPPPTPGQLLSAFGASDADLELNRQGRLGPGQKRRLWRQVALNVGIGLLMIAGLVAVLVFVGDRPIQWWRWLLVAVLSLALVAAVTPWIRKLVLSVTEGAVDCHSGPVHVFFGGGSGKQLSVHEITYNLPIPMNKVVDGASYDVYVVERPAMLVAMVPIAGPELYGPSR